MRTVFGRMRSSSASRGASARLDSGRAPRPEPPPIAASRREAARAIAGQSTASTRGRDCVPAARRGSVASFGVPAARLAAGARAGGKRGARAAARRARAARSRGETPASPAPVRIAPRRRSARFVKVAMVLSMRSAPRAGAAGGTLAAARPRVPAAALRASAGRRAAPVCRAAKFRPCIDIHKVRVGAVVVGFGFVSRRKQGRERWNAMKRWGARGERKEERGGEGVKGERAGFGGRRLRARSDARRRVRRGSRASAGCASR